MALSQVARIALQLLGIVILARLLTPEDYGLVAMVTALVGVAEVVRDFGLAPAAIQAKSVSESERSNLMWANSIIGLVLGGLVACTAWPIATFYGDPRLVVVVFALSPIFFLNGMSSQFRADLSRSMNFRAMAKIEIFAQVLALLAGIATAVTGLGFWAIVCQQIVQSLAILVIVVIAAPWRPRKFDRAVSLNRFFRYGGGLLGTQLLVYATSNIDSVLIGARFGSSQLGLYNRAFQMLVLPLNQISSPATRVALPVLSRVQAEEPEFRRFVLRGQICLSWTVLPIFGFVAANSTAVVSLVLGQQWIPAATIFSVLAVGGMFQTLSYSTYWIFLAKGLTASNFKFALITRTIMLSALCVGAVFSVHAVAAAYSASLAIIWFSGLVWISRASGFRSLKMLTLGLSTLALVALSSVASRFTANYFDFLPVVYELLLAGAAFVTTYVLLAAAVPCSRRQAQDALSVLKMLRRRNARR